MVVLKLFSCLLIEILKAFKVRYHQSHLTSLSLKLQIQGHAQYYYYFPLLCLLIYSKQLTHCSYPLN